MSVESRNMQLNARKLSIVAMLLSSLLACSSPGKDKDDATPPDDAVLPPGIANPNYVGFESAAVRPIVLSADKRQILVTNIPNHSLDIFEYDHQGVINKTDSLPVGVEPVAVALRGSGSQQEAWVVNHQSDSISIVRFDRDQAYVAKTLLVGDEPRDIVFAKNKAFITTAHRGQHRSHSSLNGVPGAGDPELHTAGKNRADVWVFDVVNPGDELGGKPEKIIELFGDTPRALAVSEDESRVYVAVLNSGNKTTAVHESVICHGFEDDNYGNKPCQVLDQKSSPNGLVDGQLPGGRTAPGVNKDGVPQPWTSMIVKYDEVSGEWRDSKGRNFSNGIRFTLPDKDVFSINTSTLTEQSFYTGVGTTLFNMAVSPVSGKIFVSNTEANNSVRFEGPGLAGGSTVQGNIARSQISVLQADSNDVSVRQLNRHIDYRQIKAPDSVKPHSVATPLQMIFSGDGSKLYVAALGSNKVAVYPTEQLENDSFWDGSGIEFEPTRLSSSFIPVAGGPVGIALNESRQQLISYARFDNSLVVTDLNNMQEEQRILMSSPEPDHVIAGRSMLYDAQRSSSNGEASCASCHIFGDTDHLSWNLGNPDASNGVNPQPIPTFKFSELGCDFVGPDEPSCKALQIINGDGDRRTFASMKGPMFTQTLKGMSTHGHMHWRGDRSVGYFGDDIEQMLDEKTSFKNFIVAFEGLLGMDIELPASVDAANKSAQVVRLEQDVDKFADFMLNIQLPANPVRGLDNSLSASAQIGRNFFHGDRRSDGLAQDSNKNGPEVDGVNCEGCHGVDHAQGFYGTRGEAAHGGEIQMFKVPQLRNLYTRVGMFGLPDRNGFLPSHTSDHQGDQVRGFGFLHDGATDLLFNFLKGGVFDNGEVPCPEGATSAHGCTFNSGRVGIPNDTVRQGLVDYLMEFDNDIAPIVGQQITIHKDSSEEAKQRLALLIQRAETPFVSKVLGGTVTECDLIAQGELQGERRSYLYNPADKLFNADKTVLSSLTATDIQSQLVAENSILTFTCLVPGTGQRFALDSDLDGVLNGDEQEDI